MNTRTLLVVAADAEWRVVERMLDIEHDGPLPPGETAPVAGMPNTAILRSGWGKVASAAATQKAIDRLEPGLIVVAGTCGGIPGRAQTGDLFIIERAVMHDVRALIGDVRAEFDHYASDADPALCLKLREITGLPGTTIGTGDRDLYIREALELAERHGVSVVDWESAAIAWVARTNNVPWAIIKGVSDMVAEPGAAAELLQHEYVSGNEDIMTGIMELLDRLQPFGHFDR